MVLYQFCSTVISTALVYPLVVSVLTVDKGKFNEIDRSRLRHPWHVRMLLKAFRKFSSLQAYTNGFNPEFAITKTNWVSLTQWMNSQSQLVQKLMI